MTLFIPPARDLVPEASGRTVACRIGNETWVSAERRWSGTYWISLNLAAAPFKQPSFGVPFDVDVTILISPESVQVLDCGMLRFRTDRLVPATNLRP